MREDRKFTGIRDSSKNKIYLGSFIRQTNFNGEQYEAIYEVVFDDGEFCLKMLKGNTKAMLSNGLSSFGHIDNGCLRKGIVIDNPKLITL